MEMTLENGAINTSNGFFASQGSFYQPDIALSNVHIRDQGTTPVIVKSSSNNDANLRSSTRRHQQAQTPISCTLCRRRKVKCDRNTPCGNCVNARVDCVPSVPSHAPRGRQGGRKRKADGELAKRIAKLEQLVHAVGEDSEKRSLMPPQSSGVKINDDKNDSSQAPRSGSYDASSTGSRRQQSGGKLDRYLGTPFWVTLSEEIYGLRDVLDDSSDDEATSAIEKTAAPGSASPGQSPLHQANDCAFVISPTTTAGVISHPTAHQLYNLCDVYLSNVDPVFKIMHAPSLRLCLQEGAMKLDCSPGGYRGLEALKMAICFVATVSMTDEECRHRLGEDRSISMARYRAGTELALAKADVVNTVEMATLQAMVVYLAAVRASDSGRLMWTLTSLAVQIARAMGLHNETRLSLFRPFEREMRRRLWWQIVLLDAQAAGDRATEPVIHFASFSTNLPLNVNDKDLHFDSFEEIGDVQGFTDMTFSMIVCEICETVAQLNYVPMRRLNYPLNAPLQDWAQRVDTAIKMQRRVEDRYLRYLNLARPFHWVARQVADIITAIMWLVVYRPLQQRSGGSIHPPTDPGILGLAVEVLDRFHRLNKDPALSPYKWLSQIFVQWHALAVTIAELCIEVKGPIVERAWAILMPVYMETSQHVADSDEGMLWRPIKKMMDRAQKLRQQYLNSLPVGAEQPGRSMDLGSFVQDHVTGGRGDSMFAVTGNVPQSLAKDATRPLDEPQLATSHPLSAPLDWDNWLAGASTSVDPSMQNHSQGDMKGLAWNNWEDFINNFQEQDDCIMAGTFGEGAGNLNQWP